MPWQTLNAHATAGLAQMLLLVLLPAQSPVSVLGRASPPPPPTLELPCSELADFSSCGGFSANQIELNDEFVPGRTQWAVAELTGIAFASRDVTVVGDTEHDVECARANGYRAVAVDTGWGDRAEIERLRPDALLEDLAVPGVLEALGVRA